MGGSRAVHMVCATRHTVAMRLAYSRAMSHFQVPIAISMGDPAGIGPEITLRALAMLAEAGSTQTFMIFGDPAWIRRRAEALRLPVPLNLEAVCSLPPDFSLGRPSAASGDAAFRSVVAATYAVLAGRARALVTAPLAKSALHEAGHAYPGHTELLAELAGQVPVRMMLANDELRTVLLSTHLSLREALDAITTEGLLETLLITDRSLRAFGLAAPRIAVAAVNPHAGENGLFGDEESRLLAPAIARARSKGLVVSDPLAPDTVYMRARGFRDFDVVIAMYHDQGLIPVKYLGIEHGVNITLGLPFVRTSPDHGTAYDIAKAGVADPSSMLAAIAQADRLSRIHRGTHPVH